MFSRAEEMSRLKHIDETDTKTEGGKETAKPYKITERNEGERSINPSLHTRTYT